jgi:polyhydroxyalkanoate synthase
MPAAALQPPPRPEAGIAELIDRATHAMMARRTLGLSPAAIGLAAADWWVHLASSPGKRLELAGSALRALHAWGDYLGRVLVHQRGEPEAGCCVVPTESDRRFNAPQWQRFPYNVIQQSFLLHEAWWREATTGVRGVAPHHEQVVAFGARQWLDMLAPSNVSVFNPEVVQTTLDSGGANLLAGAAALRDDLRRLADGAPPAGTEDFVPGHQVACTPGKVVLRNRLIELIQYAPSTAQVHAEPLLVIPAWIMKYYILDLSPHDSMVKYLVDQGHTVYMVSWLNPSGDDRDLGMDDYLELGPLAALDAVRRIQPGRRVHAAGYCLGGTLLAIAASLLAARGDDTLATLTLLASQTDFSEPGELSLFIDHSQVSFLEDMMWAQGYLDTSQMAGAFQMLRSYDLVWSRITRDYLLGKRQAPNDLMAWNADATRMPYRMHSEYLRGLYLNNDLAEGRWKALGQTVAVEDVRQPWFVVGTETDHVAPWRSVYKIHLLASSDVTFVLTSGGHNAGIVSEPGHPNRHYRWARREAGAAFVDPQQWTEQAASEIGSWWPRWSAWLAERSSALVAPPRMGLPGAGALPDSPGSYVLQR